MLETVMDGWDRAPEGCWDVLERFTKTIKCYSRGSSDSIFKVKVCKCPTTKLPSNKRC